MFENQPREAVESLMEKDADFRRLYHHHRKLDSKVHDAEIGALPMDSGALKNMKREKMEAKNRLLRMWDEHQAAGMH